MLYALGYLWLTSLSVVIMAERSNAGIQLTFALVALIAAVLYSGKAQFLLNKLNKIVHGKHGCAPITDLGDITLHYFGSRGRAEGIRFIMVDNVVQYAETNYTKDEWPVIKEKGIQTGLFTFGQVPAITTTNGLQLVQSRAIMHHIGRSLGLDCDCQDLHTCDVIVQGADDLRNKLGPVMYSPSFSPETRDKHVKEVVIPWLKYFERLAPAPAKRKDSDTQKTSDAQSEPEESNMYWIGDRITWVDYVIFELLDNHVEFGKLVFHGKAKPIDVLENYQNLKSFYESFGSRPKLARYLKSENRFPFWRYRN